MGCLAAFILLLHREGVAFLTPVFAKYPTGFHYFTAGCACDIMEFVCNPVSQD